MEAGLLFKIILVVAMFAVSLLVAMYSTFLERKVSAWMQNRKGPNRAGPLGLLQPLADGVKMFMKEEIIPNVSNKALFIIGPCVAMTTALMAGALIPWGGRYRTLGTHIFITSSRLKHWCIIHFRDHVIRCIRYYDWWLGIK